MANEVVKVTEEDREEARKWIACAVEPVRPDYANRMDEVVELFATGFAYERELERARHALDETSQQLCAESIRAERAERELAEAQAKMPRWISVTERLPRFPTHGHEFLVRSSTGYRTTLNWNGETWYSNSDTAKDRYWDQFVTHWMQIPEFDEKAELERLKSGRKRGGR